jgi:hypothetical protein
LKTEKNSTDMVICIERIGRGGDLLDPLGPNNMPRKFFTKPRIRRQNRIGVDGFNPMATCVKPLSRSNYADPN